MNSLIHAFEPDQQGTIDISIKPTDDQVNILYRDNGRGMTPDVLKHLYEPFFTTRRSQGGSGMGAHIIHDLVTERLQGSIEVHSAPGEGSCFNIHIPMHLTPCPINET